MTVQAFAKVNLTLEVYGTRPDGFHGLRSVVQPISLADTLELTATAEGDVSSDTGYGADDLIVRAARLLQTVCWVKEGVRVAVTKRIPAGGGLGGGSADAAAMLRALNGLWKLGKTTAELARLGAEIGSDVPALVLAQSTGRPVLMEGRGERVRLLADGEFPWLSRCTRHLVLVNPGVHSSTAEVYRRCVVRTAPAEGPVNDLQSPAVMLHPEIGDALASLTTAGATEVMMSGSGATVFGFAPDEAIACRLAESLRERYPLALAVRT